MTLKDAESRFEVPANVPGTAELQTNGARPKKRKARRTRSPHPGVVLVKPDAEHLYWRARYTDPDTGRIVKARLDPLALSTAELRREWAIRKAKSIRRRQMDLESGAPRATGTGLHEAVARYYDDHPNLRPKTLAAYRAATSKLLKWAERSGVRSADDVTKAVLLSFRATVVKQRKLLAASSGKRGARRASQEPRSPHSINRELRAVRTVLNYLADLELLPKVREGELRKALWREKTDTEEPVFLRSAELIALLEAALAYDADVFRETRDEHRGDGEPGSTSRYEPIAVFVATALLTGMRLGEALALNWAQVDLLALDYDGTAVGEIRLAARGNKTKRARVVDLAVSPLLRELLSVLRESSGKRGPVFSLTPDGAAAAAKRLRGKFHAPASFTWQTLRSTCATYLTNSGAIFNAASAHRSARQLGHSVTIAQKHYVNVVRLSPTARTLEAAMGIEEVLSRVIAAARE